MEIETGAARPAPGSTAREDFSGRELVVAAEMQATAAAARAKATVEARYIVAMKRPRSLMQARQTLLGECDRLSFAESALYFKPIRATPEQRRLMDRARAGDHEAKAALLLGEGGGARGPTIRLIEAALRAMTNFVATSTTVFEDDSQRVVRVEVTDLESNASYDQEFVVAKTVERASLREGQVALRTRTNSEGRTVYLVAASEDELLQKQGANVSKVIRTLGQRLMPGDLIDEAVARVKKTLEAGVAKDPKGETKRIADAFASIGVQPAMLTEFLGHDLEQCSPKEVMELRGIFAAIKDGETTWAEAIEERAARDAKPVESKTKPEVAAPATKARTTEELKAEARAAQAAKL